MVTHKYSLFYNVPAVISGLLMFLIAWEFSSFLGLTATYLIFLLLITLNTWFGGLRLGIFNTVTSIGISLFFFLLPYQFLSQLQLRALAEIGLLLLVGTLICFVIEKYKKTDLAFDYSQKEKVWFKRLHKLEEQRIKMQQEIKLRDEFLSIASHELKTPLTSMLLKIQTILHSIRNVSLANFSVEKLLQMLETAEYQTKRLSKMINDLLNISLITTGKLELELGKADLAELVKEVTGEFAEKLDKGGYKIKLQVEVPCEGIMDKLRIEQVVTNLISNAIKYGNGKPIDISVTKNSSHGQIHVTDHGIGIPNDQKEHIFALFERGGITNASYKGLGVGLYIANQIIRAHHGNISVQSKLDHGSTFTVEIPLKQAKA